MARDAPPPHVQPLTDEEVEERRPILLAGIEQFNDGYYFESHETWEELWLPSPQPVRTFLQGLIQVAAGFVHLMRHEYTGTLRLLGLALEKLEGFEDGYQGVEAARLVRDTRRARDEIEALGPERFEEWDRGRIPRIHLSERARRPYRKRRARA